MLAEGHLRQRDDVAFPPLCLRLVFIAHTALKHFCHLFFFQGLVNMWEGFMYILIQVPGQSVALLCVCCPLDPVLPGSYALIYSYHVSFLLEAREIWGYYWATGKAPFRSHVSNDLLQVLLENSEDITPHYSQKSYCFLWRHIFHGQDDIFLPLDVLLLLFKAKPALDASLTYPSEGSLSCVFSCINIALWKGSGVNLSQSYSLNWIMFWVFFLMLLC